MDQTVENTSYDDNQHIKPYSNEHMLNPSHRNILNNNDIDDNYDSNDDNSDDGNNNNNNTKNKRPRLTFCSQPTALKFILFNELCERFSYYAHRTILTMYLKSVDIDPDKAVVIFSLWSAISSGMPVLGGHISDAYWGRYLTILIFSFTYLFGLILLSLSAYTSIFNTNINHWPVYLALTLTSIGTGGIKPCASTFGADQLLSVDEINKINSTTLDNNINYNMNTSNNNTNNNNISSSSSSSSNRSESNTDVSSTQAVENPTESFFLVYYFIVNVGSIISTLLIPIVRTYWGYFWAFMIPAIFMALSIVVLIIGNLMNSFKHIYPQGGMISSVLRIFCLSCKRRKWLKHTYQIPISLQVPSPILNNNDNTMLSSSSSSSQLITIKHALVNVHDFVKYVHLYYDNIVVSRYIKTTSVSDISSLLERPYWHVPYYTCPFDPEQYTRILHDNTSNTNNMYTSSLSCDQTSGLCRIPSSMPINNNNNIVYDDIPRNTEVDVSHDTTTQHKQQQQQQQRYRTFENMARSPIPAVRLGGLGCSCGPQCSCGCSQKRSLLSLSNHDQLSSYGTITTTTATGATSDGNTTSIDEYNSIPLESISTTHSLNDNNNITIDLRSNINIKKSWHCRCSAIQAASEDKCLLQSTLSLPMDIKQVKQCCIPSSSSIQGSNNSNIDQTDIANIPDNTYTQSSSHHDNHDDNDVYDISNAIILSIRSEYDNSTDISDPTLVSSSPSCKLDLRQRRKAPLFAHAYDTTTSSILYNDSNDNENLLQHNKQSHTTHVGHPHQRESQQSMMTTPTVDEQRREYYQYDLLQSSNKRNKQHSSSSSSCQLCCCFGGVFCQPYHFIHQLIPCLDIASDEYTVLDYIDNIKSNNKQDPITIEDLLLPLQYSSLTTTTTAATTSTTSSSSSATSASSTYSSTSIDNDLYNINTHNINTSDITTIDNQTAPSQKLSSPSPSSSPSSSQSQSLSQKQQSQQHKDIIVMAPIPQQYISPKKRLTGFSIESLRIVISILPILATLPMFWCLTNQQGSTWIQQASEMNNHIWGFDIEEEQMSMLNPIFLFILLPSFEWILRKCRREHNEKTTQQRLSKKSKKYKDSGSTHETDLMISPNNSDNVVVSSSSSINQLDPSPLTLSSSQNEIDSPSTVTNTSTTSTSPNNNNTPLSSVSNQDDDSEMPWITHPLNKMYLGMLLSALAYVSAAIVDFYIEKSPKGSVSLLWQTPQYLLVTMAEILISVTGLHFIFDLSPGHMKSLLTSLLHFSSAIGDIITGSFYSIFVQLKFTRMSMFFAFGLCVFLNAFFVLFVRCYFGRLYKR